MEVLDGEGGKIDAEVISASKRETTVRAVTRHHTPKPAVALVLVQAMLKGKALDTVLEKSVELGAARIVLLETERGVARIAPEDAERKRALLTQTLVEAAKQSGNPWLPVLQGPVALRDFLKAESGKSEAKLLVASLEAGAPTIGKALGNLDQTVSTLLVAIGPEGDFSPAEYDALKASGAIPVSLGPLVLRAETAAIAALAIFGDHTRH